MTASQKLAAAAIVIGAIMLQADTAEALPKPFTCAALGGAGGAVLGAAVGSKMGIAALGTAASGMMPVAIVGAVIAAQAAGLGCLGASGGATLAIAGGAGGSLHSDRPEPPSLASP